MATCKYYLKENIVFLTLSAFSATVALYYVAFAPKGAMVLFLNHIATQALDGFFISISHSALGISLLLLSLILVIHKMRSAAAAITALAFAGSVSFVLKQFVFSGMLRPICFFEGTDLYLIEGFDYCCINSFPSGHTMSAFAFATIISVISGNKSVQSVMFFYALLVGISRMYLLQHFLEDVVAGAAIGIFCGHFALYLWTGTNKQWLNKSIQQWLQGYSARLPGRLCSKP